MVKPWEREMIFFNFDEKKKIRKIKSDVKTYCASCQNRMMGALHLLT